MGVICNLKGEMKGSVIAGSVVKECVDFWLCVVSVVSFII